VNELTKKDDNHPLARGTLIIDQTVTLTQPITIPRGYTLAGVGENGRGIIQVAAEFGGQPAIRIVNPFVTIRDLGIEAGSFGLNSGAIGIDLDPTGHIYLQNVRVASFGQYGLKAKDVGSVFVDKCQFVGNGNNLLMVGTAAFGIQSWRIRDSIIRDAKEWGIRTQGAGADLVIEGCRFEGNFFGGVRLGKGFSGAFIFGNRFEDNRTAEEKKVPIAGRGVRVDDGAISTRILCNLFSGDAITPSVPKIVLNPQEPQKANQATQIGFNVSDILEDAAFRVPL